MTEYLSSKGHPVNSRTYIMGKEATAAVLQHLPCTIPELADAMDISKGWANQLINRLHKAGTVEQWGDKLNEYGRLVQVYRRKD